MRKAIFGYGGHAREVAANLNEEMVYFVDDLYWERNTQNTLPISEFNSTLFTIMIAVSDCKTRKSIVKKLPKDTKYFTFIHPTAILLENILIEEGSFVGANCVLTSNVKIGKHSILNRNVSVGHDCVIGDYFSAMPGSVISGNVTCGECVYLGNNSSIREKVNICDSVIVGMNGAVVKNIEEEGTYVGVPAKKLNK